MEKIMYFIFSLVVLLLAVFFYFVLIDKTTSTPEFYCEISDEQLLDTSCSTSSDCNFMNGICDTNKWKCIWVGGLKGQVIIPDETFCKNLGGKWTTKP